MPYLYRLVKGPHRQGLWDRCRFYRSCLTDHYHFKYVGYAEALGNLYRNLGRSYSWLSLGEVRRRFKRSDTVFIPGSGVSLNALGPAQFAEIERHEAFGVNFSFLKRQIRSTYHSFAWEGRDPESNALMAQHLQRDGGAVKNAVLFHNEKFLGRLGHPWLTPTFFPPRPRMCMYFQPPAIEIEDERPFTDADFDRSLFYRGSLTLVLQACVTLGYRRIVLLGIDPHTIHHFYDDLPEMSAYCAMIYGRARAENRTVFEGMVPKRHKSRTIDDYFRAAAEYLARRRKITLFAATRDSFLGRDLPAYF